MLLPTLVGVILTLPSMRAWSKSSPHTGGGNPSISRVDGML